MRDKTRTQRKNVHKWSLNRGVRISVAFRDVIDLNMPRKTKERIWIIILSEIFKTEDSWLEDGYHISCAACKETLTNQ
jgi:hypothetical protein